MLILCSCTYQAFLLLLFSVQGRLHWHMDDRVQDFTKVTFDMDADFSNLFNWNTKQLFLSLVAEYPSTKHVRMRTAVRVHC